MIDFFISLFIKPDAVQDCRAYEEPKKKQPSSEEYNEVMRHQHEMRKQLYKKLKL
jgi:hypothetical protein